LLREEARRKKNAGQKDRPERAENDHGELDDIGWAGFQCGAHRFACIPLRAAESRSCDAGTKARESDTVEGTPSLS
jgi:hypothetical protein